MLRNIPQDETDHNNIVSYIIGFVTIGRKYNNVNNLYTKPLNSSLIGIHLVDRLSECFSYWPLLNILHKLIRLPHIKEFVVMPLLHTEE